MIKRNEASLTITKKCELLELSRSSYYYKSRGETSENIMLMEYIDRIHTEHITWGSRKIRDYLRNEGIRLTESGYRD